MLQLVVLLALPIILISTSKYTNQNMPKTFIHQGLQGSLSSATFTSLMPKIPIKCSERNHEIPRLAFSGRPALLGMQRMSYNGLDIAFSSYNDQWREMRKVSNLHLFSPKQIQFFRPIREDEVSMMIKKISRDASLSRVTNLSQLIYTMMSNTICRLALAKSSMDEGFASRTHELFSVVQGAFATFCVEDYFPLLGWIDKISGTRRKLEKTFRKLDSFYEELIEEHLDENRPKAMEGDILDILLGLKRDGLSSIPFTMDHVKAVLMYFQFPSP
ncbi:cytochrome [Sesamum alatum]|uniref:Cytochrome n=1 Tax=Sesamum alatum TaxID=300844 RepID=A0AAE1YBX1_9LAMI|nr:cytochrome [Sesamum alatum]